GAGRRSRCERDGAHTTGRARDDRFPLPVRVHAESLDRHIHRSVHRLAVQPFRDHLDHPPARLVVRDHRGPGPCRSGPASGRARPRHRQRRRDHPDPDHRVPARAGAGRCGDPGREGRASGAVDRALAAPPGGGGVRGADRARERRGDPLVQARRHRPARQLHRILGLVRIALLLALGLVMTLHTGARTTRSQAATRGLLVAAWVGLGAAMTRIPPPQYFVDTSISQVFMGFDVPEPPTLATLLGPGRLNLLFLVVAVAAVLGYLAMTRQLRRRGVHWPVARTVLWIAGWLTV